MTDFQIDYVLQKENLSPQSQVHPAMHMPSHGEFLVEHMAQTGFKTGLVFGLDDFALNGAVLNRSPSDVLIVCGADQHYNQAFLETWQRIKKNYACRILIVSEPIYSPFAFYQGSSQNAQSAHEHFLMAFEPDIVLYLSRFDCLEAQKRLPSGLKIIQYSLADSIFLNQDPIPWSDKEAQLLWLGKPDAWQCSRTHQKTWTRLRQLTFFRDQIHYPFMGFSRQFTFRSCYQVANRFRFQIQPKSGFAFHTARAVQAAICGSIPIILLHQDYQALLAIEAPFAIPGENLILAFDGQYADLWEKLHDETYCLSVVSRLPELLQAGIIRTGLESLTHEIKYLLNK